MSEGKHVSHGRLASFIGKHDLEALVRVYRRDQLMKLCEAYELAFNKRATKKVLAVQLQQAIRTHNRVPQPFILDNRQYSVEHVQASGEGQGIIVRFRRYMPRASTATISSRESGQYGTYLQLPIKSFDILKVSRYIFMS